MKIPTNSRTIPAFIGNFIINFGQYAPNFTTYIVNANEAYLNKNEVNLGINARLIVESLCNCYFLRYSGFENIELATKISLLPKFGYFSQKEINVLNAVRKAGNDSAHAVKNDFIDTYKVYEAFYDNLESYIEKVYIINNAEELPQLFMDNNRTDNDFMLYSDDVIRAYKKLRGWAIFYVIVLTVIFSSPLFGGLLYTIQGNLSGLLYIIPSIIILALSYRYIFVVRKAHNAKLAYEVDQKRYNYRVKYVKDQFFPPLNGDIDYSINCDDLYRD